MKVLKLILRVSLLLLMVVLGFTAIFPSWLDHRDIIYKEVTRRFMSDEKVLMLEKVDRKTRRDKKLADIIERQYRKRSAKLGVAYEDYKKETDDFRLLNEQLKNAIEVNDTALIKTLAKQFLPEQLNSNYLIKVIESENVEAFVALYENSSACYAKQSRVIAGAEKDKVISDFYDPSRTERVVYYRILQGSDDEILRAWFKAGCLYDVAKYADSKSKFEFLGEFSKALVKRGASERIFSLKGLSGYGSVVNSLIHQNLIAKKEEIAQSLLERNYSHLTQNQKQLNLKFQSADNSNQASSDILFQALQRGQLLYAKTVLEYDPNYIKRNKLTAEIYRTLLSKKFPDRDTVIFLSDGYLDFKTTDINMSEALVDAVENPSFEKVNLLLRHDSEISLKNLPVANWEKFDRAIQNKSLSEFRFLLSRGLDFEQFDFKGLDQLASAMNAGDEKLVHFLLSTALVAPAIVYRGATILDTKIGGDSDTQTRILTQLKKYGAHDDYFQLVREKMGVTEDPNCSIGQQLELASYADSHLLTAITNASIRKIGLKNTANVMDFCEASLTYCTYAKGHSIDDCVTSIPVCPETVPVDPNLMKPADICCPNEVQNTYIQGRCSGLDAISSTIHLRGKGFHETYTIPTFLTKTKEYKTKSLDSKFFK